jgi:hypothetical protein
MNVGIFIFIPFFRFFSLSWAVSFSRRGVANVLPILTPPSFFKSSQGHGDCQCVCLGGKGGREEETGGGAVVATVAIGVAMTFTTTVFNSNNQPFIFPLYNSSNSNSFSPAFAQFILPAQFIHFHFFTFFILFGHSRKKS